MNDIEKFKAAVERNDFEGVRCLAAREYAAQKLADAKVALDSAIAMAKIVLIQLAEKGYWFQVGPLAELCTKATKVLGEVTTQSDATFATQLDALLGELSNEIEHCQHLVGK